MRRLATFCLVLPLLAAVAAPAAAQPPPTTEELLSGMVTEEIEPGVFRVVNDGVRDLSWPTAGISRFEADEGDVLITGHDGSVWLMEAGGLQELGEESLLPYPNDWRWRPSDGAPAPRFAVAADGTPWVAVDVDDGRVGLVDSGLYSYDGRDWRLRLDGANSLWAGIDFRLGPDGTVWALTSKQERFTPGRYRFLRLDGKEWTKLPKPPTPARDPRGRMWAWIALDDDTLWSVREREVSRFDGDRWKMVAQTRKGFEDLAITPDGKTRIVYKAETADGPRVRTLRRDGQWAGSDGPPLPGAADTDPDGRPWLYALAPDGSVWRSHESFESAPGCHEGDTHLVACGGLARSNGRDWHRYLPGVCPAEIDFDADGNAWVQASTATPAKVVTECSPPGCGWLGNCQKERPAIEGELQTVEPGPVELYVITPEAMAAIE